MIKIKKLPCFEATFKRIEKNIFTKEISPEWGRRITLAIVSVPCEALR